MMGDKVRIAAARGRAVVLEETVVKLTAAQVLTLNASPVVVIRAQPGEILIPFAMSVYKPAGTAYGGIAAGEDLSLEDTDATSLLTMETTGFLDQATEQYRVSTAAAITAKATGAGKNLQLKMLAGEITTGDSPLTFCIAYWRVAYQSRPTLY